MEIGNSAVNGKEKKSCLLFNKTKRVQNVLYVIKMQNDVIYLHTHTEP